MPCFYLVLFRKCHILCLIETHGPQRTFLKFFFAASELWPPATKPPHFFPHFSRTKAHETSVLDEHCPMTAWNLFKDAPAQPILDASLSTPEFHHSPAHGDCI